MTRRSSVAPRAPTPERGSQRGGYWAICPEIPGANGQGETLEETKESLRQAIEMILSSDEADTDANRR
ncbi:hypothetical protein CKO27_23240 [Thiocystis violacea]|nr:hypothetical protein [Thiocystis violacea]